MTEMRCAKCNAKLASMKIKDGQIHIRCYKCKEMNLYVRSTEKNIDKHISEDVADSI